VLGWESSIDLEEGISRVVEWFSNESEALGVRSEEKKPKTIS
jgi:dTDP-D-glucose 4,6-dehydratase